MLNHHEVKRRREAKKLSQAEAARQAGFASYQQWWNVENGRSPMPRLDTLLALANVLECSISELVVEKYRPAKRKK